MSDTVVIFIAVFVVILVTGLAVWVVYKCKKSKFQSELLRIQEQKNPFNLRMTKRQIALENELRHQQNINHKNNDRTEQLYKDHEALNQKYNDLQKTHNDLVYRHSEKGTVEKLP